MGLEENKLFPEMLAVAKATRSYQSYSFVLCLPLPGENKGKSQF